MKFFIGLVPPGNIYEHFETIQKRYGDNRMEPHITIRGPVTVLEQNEWVKKITAVAAAFEPFPVSLPGTGNFGKRVLYVQVQSESLERFYHALIPQLKPFEASEPNKVNGDYHPHLTLGRTWCGFTAEDFTNMKQLADEYLRREKVSFVAKTIRIYHKPDHHGRYQVFEDIPLGSPTA
jgi:2'-5' RNA ligase